jgi:hypothetical protein
MEKVDLKAAVLYTNFWYYPYKIYCIFHDA